MEALLRKYNIISGSFSDIKAGRLSKRTRALHVCLFLWFSWELVKYILWLWLPQSHPLYVNMGPFLLQLGSKGKMLYLCFFFVIQDALLRRLIFFFKESSGKGLEFLFDPISFVRRNTWSKKIHRKMSVINNDMGDIHQGFVKEFHRLLMAATSEARAEIAIGNCYVGGCCLFVVMKQGLWILPAVLVFSFLSNSLDNYHYFSGITVSNGVWKASIAFLRMHIKVLKRRMQVLLETHVELKNQLEHPDEENFRPRRSLDRRYLENKSNSLLIQIKEVMQLIDCYDRSLRWFLFSTLMSTTPNVCGLIFPFFFGDYERNIVIDVIYVMIAVVIMFEGLEPLFQTSRVWSDSKQLVPLMNSLYMASNESISCGHKIKFSRILKSLNNPWRPMSLCDAVGTPYTTHHFFEVRQETSCDDCIHIIHISYFAFSNYSSNNSTSGSWPPISSWSSRPSDKRTKNLDCWHITCLSLSV